VDDAVEADEDDGLAIQLIVGGGFGLGILWHRETAWMNALV